MSITKDLDAAARKYAGGVTIGYYPNNEDRYVAFKAGAAWERERSEKLLEALRVVEIMNSPMGWAGCSAIAKQALAEYEGTNK
jgi:hypothetical protein